MRFMIVGGCWRLLEVVGVVGGCWKLLEMPASPCFFVFDVSEKNERMTSFKNRLPGLLS
jgi:hypothetical protein